MAKVWVCSWEGERFGYDWDIESSRVDDPCADSKLIDLSDDEVVELRYIIKKYWSWQERLGQAKDVSVNLCVDARDQRTWEMQAERQRSAIVSRLMVED